MEKYVKKQLDLFKRIRSTVENMRKMGAAKLTKGVITSRLELIEKNWAAFLEVHDQLIDVFSQTEPDNQYFKLDYIGQCEEAYVQQKAILLDLKEEYTTDNVSLSPVEKLHYLKTSLTGEPALLLQNIPVTDDNFERVWTTITERYQNLRVLIHAQLTSLMSQQPIKRESSRALKELLNGTTDAVQALEALKRPVRQWDDWLVFITAEKLDPRTRMSWETSIGSTSEPPTFEQLRTFLTTKLRALEAVEGSSSSSAAPTEKTGVLRHEKKTPLYTTPRLKAYATHTTEEANRRCLICQKEHFILFCPTYKNLNPRERKLLIFWKVSVVLATAELVLESDQGKRVSVRALIDPCSEVSLLEESVAQFLNLIRIPEKIPVVGVAYILPRLSSYQAMKSSSTSALSHLDGLALADPHIFSSRRINLILGADIYVQIIRSGLRKGPPNTLIAQATSLGWILTGPLRQSSKLENNTHYAISLQCSIREANLVETLTRFWRTEEVPSISNSLTEDQKACEDHYTRTHKRDESGRYIVSLPLKSSPAELGESKKAASSFFSKLERRFDTDPKFQNAYREFLREYEDLGHMERISDHLTNKGPVYYLPHHGVLRESSSTTKLRVVFNASCKTSSGTSLNDLVHTGPNLLPEIFSLLLRWRKYAIAFSADVEKMYRQILVEKKDCDLQRIVWRDNPGEQLTSYRLRTVTYGMACAPYLAIRTLLQLSRDEEEAYPLAARCLRSDVYMDDVVSGSDTLEEAGQLQQQLLALLRAGGFKLRKWSSNEPELLKTLPVDHLASSSDLSCNFDGVSSLLGLKWNTASDCFLVSLRPPGFNSTVQNGKLLLPTVFPKFKQHYPKQLGVTYALATIRLTPRLADYLEIN
ncbi:uncharacterized protein LOC143348733 [Colletes latitarsis]|uniref:uncharacterized protein LOC143348733 n=1 Tax=Colletes latitarsis TaxID=2605962 RepID=UPI004034FD09